MEKFKNTENPVRSTTLEVVKKAKDVKINRARIRDLAEEWAKNDLIVPVWPKDFHLQSDSRIFKRRIGEKREKLPRIRGRLDFMEQGPGNQNRKALPFD